MSTATSTRTQLRGIAGSARRPLFYVITAVFLGFLLLALNEPIRFVYLAWTPDYGFFTHRVHHVTIGAILALLVVSIAIQLFRPARQVGAYLLALVGVLAFTVVSIPDGAAAIAEMAIFLVPLLLIGLLHPGLRSFRLSRETMDVRMLAVAAVAAVPLAIFAAIQLNLHLTAVDDHVIFGHYQMMAAGALTIGVGAVLASFRPAGWRFLTYGVAIFLGLMGAASAAFPGAEQGTNFGVVGGVLAIVWAVGFVAVAEYEAHDRETAHDAGVAGESDPSDQGATDE